MEPVYIVFDKQKKEIIYFSNNIEDIKPFKKNTSITFLKAIEKFPTVLLNIDSETLNQGIISFLKRKKQSSNKDNIKVIVKSYFENIKQKYPTLDIELKKDKAKNILFKVLPNYKVDIEEELVLISKKEVSNKLKGLKRKII